MNWLLEFLGTTIAEMIGSLIGFIFSLLGDMRLTGLNTALEGISKYIRAACYFLPMDTIAIIFGLVITIWNVRLILKTITMIWNLLPIA